MLATPSSLLALLVALALPASSLAAGSGGRVHSGSSFLKRQNNNNGTNNNLQTSLTLDASQVQSNLADDDQTPPVAGQVASLTSTNNFINFCATANLAITNGLQVIAGSCNPTIMGSIVAQAKAPSCKFSNPKNGDTITADTTFTMTMNIVNLQTGSFTNAQKTYFAAPAQLNGQSILIGHSHVVIEAITSLDSTTPADTTKFAFFKGLNDPAANGVLTATVTGGLPAGFYKMSSINSAANHQPAHVGVAQHGTLDDTVYFTVTAAAATGNTGNNNNNGGNNNNAATTTVATTPAAAVATTASGNNGNNNNNNGGNNNNNNNNNATSAAAAVATTATASTSTSGNLQTFTGALGGAAPAVTAAGNGKFTSGGTQFNSASSAIDRSCSVQQNVCSNAANSGNKSLSVSGCTAQETACKALNTGN